MLVSKIEFEFLDDQTFFENLLCQPPETLDRYYELFDFRSPQLKRREFSVIRNKTKENLELQFGPICMLNFASDCDPRKGLVVDHLIPLSSNKLNKLFRKMQPSRNQDGVLKKVLTQSFGSNSAKNLILACHNCNSLKQNSLLESEIIRRIINQYLISDGS